jgi:hypothetical protein
MRSSVVGLLVVLLVTSAAAEEFSPLRLQESDIGKLPQGWTSASTGEGEGSVWKVVRDESVPGGKGLALEQTAKGPKPLFHLCVTDAPKPSDLEMTVDFRPVSGGIDQGGGLVWRYQDHQNYYIARFNPLEKNFRVYKVLQGKRTQLATQEDLELGDGWHQIKIVQAGTSIECYLDGKKHLEVHDESISRSGNVGLWTKADAVTRFANLKITVK